MFPIEARFTGKGGWRTQAETAAGHLTVGEVYTVLRMDVGRSSSHLVLVDFPDLQFNTVMFEGVPSRYADEDEDADAPPADPAAVPGEIRKAAHDAACLPLSRAFRTSPAELIDLALDAVCPLIRADERERTREAIERIERLAAAAQETAIAHAVRAERERIRKLAEDRDATAWNAPLDANECSRVPFADLIGEDT